MRQLDIIHQKAPQVAGLGCARFSHSSSKYTQALFTPVR